MSNMLFRLMCLYQNGVELGMEELLSFPRPVGYLVFEDWTQRRRFSSFNWRARLLDMEVTHRPRDIVPPLYNPYVVKMPDMEDLHMTLYGYESDFKNEHAIAHIQYWVLIPVTPKEGIVIQNPILV